MTKKNIHIVSFDVPFEPNYGGVLDVFLRAKALKNVGFHVTMHCFDYGRGINLNVSECADEVRYYKRNSSIFSFFGKLPFIVQSRANADLLQALLHIDDFILFEGQHCTAFVEELKKAGKKFAIRMHNVEWIYYSELAKRESNLLKRTFFKRESKKLREQEKELLGYPLICISKADANYYQNLGARVELAVTPLFFEENATRSDEKYALYHGNLSVNENVEALEVMIKNIQQSKTDFPIKIAGKNPSKKLIAELNIVGIECIPNPSSTEMKTLIDKATVHLCIGFQESGLKLKLLQSLETGKPCIVTKQMLFGTDLEKFCEIWNPKTPLSTVLTNLTYNQAEIELRRKELKQIFTPERYVGIIEKLISAKS